MPDNERDQIIEQVAHVLIDVDWQNVASDAYDMARALDREGLLRTGDDTGEVTKLRAERDRYERIAKLVVADRDRAVAETAALRARIEKLHVERLGFCGECDRKWPCDTIRALDGGQA